MSFGFSSGFGGGSQSPFGSQNPMGGQSTPAFGQSPSPFGGAQGGSMFGQSQSGFGAPTGSTGFGAAPSSGFGAAPAFGAASSGSAFGSSGFGSKPAGFGFGASAPSFGAPASTPAFGGSGFGTTSPSPFGSGGGTFGQQPQQQQSPSPFGGSTGFGQSQQAFGSASPGTFGSGFGQQPQTGGFGASPMQQRGTRNVAWKKTQEIDQSSSGVRNTVQFNSISCMPEYNTKSVEELRWEDYQDGVKGGGQQGSPGGGMFGQQQQAQPSVSPFGQPSQPSQPSVFGASSTPSFGSTFGSTMPASSSAFGSPGSSAFGSFGAPGTGQSSSAFGGFGASSTPAAFGASSTPSFGMSSSAFGAGSSTPSFGAPSSTPAFGMSTPSFGSGSAFGATATPAFGASLSTPSFGGAQSTPSLFGSQTSTPAFGASSQSSPLFGASSGVKPGGFAFSSPGTTSFSLGQSQPAQGGGLFGSAPAPSFSSGLFGASSASPGVGQSQSGFSFQTQTAQPAFGAFGAAPQTSAAQPGVAINQTQSSPYGSMPEAAKITPLPEYKVGLTQRILAPPSAGPPKPVALISPRSLTPHGGGKLRPRKITSATRLSKSPAEFFATGSLSATPGSMTPTPGTTENIFVPRENPRRLLIRDELPSTSGATHLAYSGTSDGVREHFDITPGSSGKKEVNGHVSPPSSLTFRSLSPQMADKENLKSPDVTALLPKLTMDDYYTVPSSAQLKAMAKEDSDSLSSVANFTVGRKKIGEIKWLEPVDIRGLDLDSLISLAKGSIEVYPDESVKPAFGEGLNCPATITMLGVHKVDKATGRPTKDPEAVEKYCRKLKKISAEQGAEFVSYDGDTGIWKFNVEHFSKYGLHDSSDEDEAQNGPEEPQIESEQNDDRENNGSEDSEDEVLGLVNRQRLKNVEKNLLKLREEAHALPTEGDLQVSMPHELSNIRSDLAERPYMHFNEYIEVETEDMEGDDESMYWSSWQTADLGGIQAPSTLPVQTLSVQAEGKRSFKLNGITSRNLADYGRLYQASFRVGWGRNGHYLAPQRSNQNVIVMKNDAFVSNLSSENIGEVELDFMLNQLKLHFEYSFPSEEAAQCSVPRWSMSCSRYSDQLKHLTVRYMKICSDYIKQALAYQLDARCKAVKHEVEIWGLLDALFSSVPAEDESSLGPEDTDNQIISHMDTLVAMQRKSEISSWLKQRTNASAKSALQELSGNEIAKKMITCLSAHDLGAAAACAAASGYMRLSTLISTAGYGIGSVQKIQEQLKVWEESGYMPHIETEVITVYELLGGQVERSIQLIGEDWKRCFGLYLWYATQKKDPISVAVEAFTAAVEDRKAPWPSPWYTNGEPDDESDPADLAFELIRMFCMMELQESPNDRLVAATSSLPHLLNPLGVSPNTQDCSFLWHMMHVLKAVGVIPQKLPDSVMSSVNRISSSYISQIEAVGGLSHWAIYVALHIQDDEMRERTIKDLLERYCEEWKDDEEVIEFMEDKLGIPLTWLEAAKATWAEAHHDNELLLESLIESENWSKAHSVLLRLVGPQWLLAKGANSEEGVLWANLMGTLERLEEPCEVDAASWRTGGDIYLTYLRLQRRFLQQGCLDPEDEETVNELASNLDKAYDGLSNSTDMNEICRLQKAAYSRIAQDIAVWSHGNGDFSIGKKPLRYATAARCVHDAAITMCHT